MSLKTEDLMATDQITVYKYEEGGEESDQKKINEFFSEEKYSLVHFNYYNYFMVKNHPYQLNSLYTNSQNNYISNGTSCITNNNSLTDSVSPTGSINFQSQFCNNTQSILNQNKIQNDFFKQPNHQTNGNILIDNKISTNSLNSTDNLSAFKAHLNSNFMNSMLAQHCNFEQYRQASDLNSVMSNLNAAVAAQNKLASSPTQTPNTISNQAFIPPATNTMSSPYSMYNFLFNGAMENRKAFCDLLADANNNPTIKPENSVNRSTKNLTSTSVSNLNKNSNSINNFYETQFHNNLSNNRNKIISQKSTNSDLSKENHFNYSNVNNSSISQNHKLPLETSNGYLNSTSISPLVNDNTVLTDPNSFLSSYYYGNPFNSLSSFNNKPIKKEPEKNQAFINNKLFCPSFPNAFNTNSLRLNSNLTNLSSSKNSTFSSNEFSSTCSPNSSSANSAASALSAFNLADSTAALYASSSINKNNCSVNSSSNRSINSPIGEISNTLNPFSHLNNQFSQQFNNKFNQKTEQNFNEQVKIENNLKDKNSKLNSHKVHVDTLNTSNLSTSNNNSLGSSFNEVCNSDQNLSNSGSNSTHVKKPLNAFMLFMKDNRKLVLEESTLKESAAINQKLGKMWHSLSNEEQEKYFQKAKKEREIHHILYPNWTAKDNYAINIRKKKRKKEKSNQSRQFKEYTNSGGSLKKCRARYGLLQQESWCKPCKRKKKCTKFEDNLQNDELNKG